MEQCALFNVKVKHKIFVAIILLIIRRIWNFFCESYLKSLVYFIKYLSILDIKYIININTLVIRTGKKMWFYYKPFKKSYYIYSQ